MSEIIKALNWRYATKSFDQTKKISEKAWHQPQVTEASHLIVLCSKTDVSEEYIKEFIKETAKTRNIPVDSLKGYEDMMIGFRKGHSKETISEWSKKQTYIPLGMLLESAALKKINACPMEGFNPNGVDEILGLNKEGFTSAVLCSLGYRSSEDKSAEYAKVRHPHSRVIERR